MPIKVTKIESVYFQFVQVWTVKGTQIVWGTALQSIQVTFSV